MSIELGYSMAFMIGIMGSFHCLGMCGGMAAGFFAGYGWQPKLQPHLLYHSARIATYTLLTIGSTLLGRVLIQNGIVGKGQGIIFITAGLIVVIIGLWLGGFLPWGRQTECKQENPSSCQVPFGRQQRRNSIPLLAGLINGMIPCSLVFSVAVKAITTGDPVRSGLLMLCFGLGTVPTMLLLTTTGAVIGEKTRRIFAWLTGVMVILLGIWTMYEGVVFYDIMRGLAN